MSNDEILKAFQSDNIFEINKGIIALAQKIIADYVSIQELIDNQLFPYLINFTKITEKDYIHVVRETFNCLANLADNEKNV